MRDSVFEALKSGASLLAASQRQARALQIAYARRMQDEERLAWPSPDILTWKAWLERCWDEFTAPSSAKERLVNRALLSPVQEAKVWESVIADSSFGDGLLQTHATARVAEEAWRLSREWVVSLPRPDAAPNEDARAFAIWSQDFDVRCRARGWQDRARLADTLGEAFASGHLNAPKRLLLFGFEELTRQQERLLEVLRHRGTAVETTDAGPLSNTLVRYEFPGPLEELAAAAQWARKQLEAGATRIGIVVPELGTMRPQVVRIFDDTFVPGAVLPGFTNATRPYNLSLGQPLSQYPVVHTALQILELGKGELPCEETGSLLRSPFLGGATEERQQRSLLDVACRQAEPLVRVNGLLRLAQDQDRDGGRRAHSAPMLAARLKSWRALLDSFPKKQLPSVWAEGFARELLALGWPGDRPLDSDEYQTVETWRELLSGLSTLDEATDRISYAEAFSTLVHMAGGRIFQPETPEVPVQVMGLLEAAGLEFDGLWITGLHDAAWPGHPRPNPFIPIELQRRYNLPHASAVRELEFARRMTGWLLASAPEIIVSHPRRSGDEDRRPSPLITHLSANEPEMTNVTGALHRLVHESRPLREQISDERASTLPAGAEISRGTGVFKDQAACPFRAFARARLGARALDKPEPGLDASERGTLLHGVMKALWLNLKSHKNLCALPEDALRLAVRTAVEAAVDEMTRERPQTFTARFITLERARLEQLVLGWLEIEKQRAPFIVVLPEKDQTASYGGLMIRIVPDRVDELEDGARVVIDYKTGTPKLNQWCGNRPDEPQLPLYALAQDYLVAVAFAQIRKDDTRFLGIAAKAGLLPKVNLVADTKELATLGSWESVLADWKRVLETLGESFRAGDARVAPKDGTRTCEYCDVGPLCRIRELEENLQVGSDDEA